MERWCIWTRKISSLLHGLQYSSLTFEINERKVTDLLTKNSKIWFKDCFDLSDHINQRSTIHVFQDKRDDSIVIERMVANNNMWTLWCLIYLQLLHNLFAEILLYIHLDDLLCITHWPQLYINLTTWNWSSDILVIWEYLTIQNNEKWKQMWRIIHPTCDSILQHMA